VPRHIVISGRHGTEDFTSPPAGKRQGPRIPPRSRRVHSSHLRRRLREAWRGAQSGQRAVAVGTRNGVYLEFKGRPGFDLITKSMDDLRSKKVRLLNVRQEVEDGEQTSYATVYVADEKKGFLLKKIAEYANPGLDSEKTGRPRNDAFARSIEDIRSALLVESFWQDSRELIPSEGKVWCEVWLSGDSPDVVTRFEELLESEQIEASKGTIRFPERSVKVILADGSQLKRLLSLSDDIAEYRRAKDTAAFWLGMENAEQAGWARDLLARLDVDDDASVSVCILDTGVSNGHPLLAPVLGDPDCHAVDPAWGTHDHEGHGTLMAGLAAYGDLQEHLGSGGAVQLRHCLESVKLLPPKSETRPELWGDYTGQAISRAEVQAPERRRVICMAVTADDTRDQGRPSSWSAAVDQLAAGVMDNERRLLIVCAGNAADYADAAAYPDSQLTDSIHDPAQSWNALTVGAFTQLADIRDSTLSGYRPMAKEGGLSPFSTTSLEWQSEWPLKPDVVMEGGNLAHLDGASVTQCDDLSLISTYHDTSTRHFYGFDMTSAATAQAAWFAAQIMDEYPDMWPETVRALIVHSADWTAEMKRQFLRTEAKSEWAKMLRICGFGAPNLERALRSASDYLTLVAQAEMQPYDKRERGSGYRAKDMHLYELPWPADALMAMPPETQVAMRVTLSYFVEPGPGEIGWRDRYRYPSHLLRFDVKSPRESIEDFRKRLNKAAREENEGSPGTASASPHWRIGSQARRRGSLHSDIWEGSAADLATSGVVAVFPAIGWWRERAHLGKWNKRCRYSLIVSISAPEVGVDIYTPVATQVGVAVSVDTGYRSRNQHI